MIELPLRIRHSSARREPAAWFIPGGGPSAWLEEIASWGVPQAGLRLRIVPRSRADLRSLGVLVTGVEQQPSPRCLPYGRIARPRPSSGKLRDSDWTPFLLPPGGLTTPLVYPPAYIDACRLSYRRLN